MIKFVMLIEIHEEGYILFKQNY